MSDLISRSKVISVLEQLEEHSLSGKMDISNAIYLLEKQPTAYSVGKVVEELEELEVKSVTRYEDGNFGDYDGVDYYIKKSEAIEIVKHGGVSDDVCKWRKHSICGFYSEHIGAVRIINIADGYKYCPYCGKKIKIVGD